MTHSPDMVTMDSLHERLRGKGLVQQPELLGRAYMDRQILAVTADSRRVESGSVFVAIEGSESDGHDFISAAVSSGAVLVISERLPETENVLLVTNARQALAEVACALEGDPSSALGMTAVTGTNGKTTTAWLVAQALSATGIDCGFIGTTGYGRPGQLRPARHTTPDPVQLQSHLAALKEDGCVACVLEASSHAIDQDRIWGIDFQAAIFTNLTRDHLDYHPSLTAYMETKARLFTGLGPSALAVTNADDPSSRSIVARTEARVVTYGKGPDADVAFAVRSDTGSGLQLRLDGVDARFQLSGAFNAYNLAAAYCALESYGLGAAERIGALGHASAAPGRFEIQRLTRDRVGVVDYAHTPAALQNVLDAARTILPVGAHLWCVFGCGGDRDAGKRPIMGAIAERLADRVVVTSDNPRTEAAPSIMADIRTGFRHPDQALWIEDRREAIHSAIKSSGLGDVVVVAGKGHEPNQVIGTDRLPFSDLDEILLAEED